MPRSLANILVVDDDPDHRFLIERTLRNAGYGVRTVERGVEAVTMLEDADLVLLDYRLPDMNGLDVLNAINELDGPSVVMVTAMGSEHVAVEAMRSGAVDYVVKDTNYLQSLPQVIERAFRVHDMSRRARMLQRITLMVNSSLDRVAVSREIVRGARQVLRAEAVGLYVLGADGEVEETLDGVAPGTAESVRVDARAIITGVDPKTDGADRLLVPLPEHEGRRLGVLAVLTEEPRHFAPEELRLAETFAAFAGIALANSARLELERSLVSELQQTLDLRRAMVMSLSHELRTPL
ncbi:MAG TPA: response regulator, partial [Acidimicrobiales bacterium]|nr:response regulator [Acidimicrobiales bacterium]